jgi:hypothetical protein
MGTTTAVEKGSVVFGGMIALSSTHSKPIETPVDEVVNRCKPGETRGKQMKLGENQEKPGENSRK